MLKILLSISIVVAVIGSVLYFQNYPNSRNASNTSTETTINSSKNTGSIGNDTRPDPQYLIGSTHDKDFSIAQITASNRSFYSSATVPEAKYEIEKYFIWYYSETAQGERITIHSQLYLPISNNNERFPVYIFGQGTTGLSDMCAPSKEQPRIDNWGDYEAHMLSYASEGFIVLFPDYAGFNDPDSIHPYFIAQLEAQVLLDGARALYEFFDDSDKKYSPMNAIFYGGYSQGGHASFAISDHASTYAPELPIKGVISYGGTTDIPNLLKENPALAPYLVYAYSDYYGRDTISPEDILRSDLIPSLNQTVLNTCIGKIYNYYPNSPDSIYNESFLNALFNDSLDRDFPEIKAVFDKNNTGLRQSNIPGLVLQGSNDPIVTVRSQKEFIQKSCSAGNHINYIEYSGIHHYQTRQVSFIDAVNWMKQVLEGNAPQSYCTDV
jgi:dienelactone hydrolase